MRNETRTSEYIEIFICNRMANSEQNEIYIWMIIVYIMAHTFFQVFTLGNNIEVERWVWGRSMHTATAVHCTCYQRLTIPIRMRELKLDGREKEIRRRRCENEIQNHRIQPWTVHTNPASRIHTIHGYLDICVCVFILFALNFENLFKMR